MKKNKCLNCLIGCYYQSAEIEFVFQNDDDFSNVIPFQHFNYCPFCRS